MPRKSIEFDPFLAFVNARGFHIASSAIDNDAIARPILKYILFWPNLATEALGLELHLKCLRAVRGNFEVGHDIEEQYGALLPEDKAEIEERLAHLISINPHYRDYKERGAYVDIQSILQRAKNMYTDARYWHEGKWPSMDSHGRIGNAGIGPLSDAIYELLIRLHPDWPERLRHFKINHYDDGQQPT
jgi:hypothetical protein